MDPYPAENFLCPYCGSENILVIDSWTNANQHLVVDCEVCCRPIVVDIKFQGTQLIKLEARPENE